MTIKVSGRSFFGWDQIFVWLAGAIGGGIAIASMLVARHCISTGVHTVRDLDCHRVGLTQSGAGPAARANRGPPYLDVRWPSCSSTLRIIAFNCGAGCWSSDYRDASDRHVSPAGGHRSAHRCAKSDAVGLPHCSDWHWCSTARIVCPRLAQSCNAAYQDGR
jgi:hypothetical protein